MADMADRLVGQDFGGYEILEEIGRGGMAVVYKARQVSMNRIVAVKVLPGQFVNDDTFRARFEREVNIVARLEHRAIVPVHDYGEAEDIPYIVMRYMGGGNVDDLLIHGPLEYDRAAAILGQIADGLDYAHSKGVLHRDLKPSNILLDEAGDAYLTDFGIASLAGGIQITTDGVVGTPAYMSPEQAQGLTLDGRSDVYGLAVLAFEMLTGRRPYEADTPYGIAVKHVTAAVPSARQANPQLTLPIDSVLQRGLAKNRAERYQTSASFTASLNKAIRATAAEVAASTAGTRPVDLSEAHRKLEAPEEVYVSAPQRTGEAPAAGYTQPTPVPHDSRVTPQSSARVHPTTPPPQSAARPRRLWVNVVVGVVIGLAIFALVVAGVIVLSVWGGRGAATLTPLEATALTGTPDPGSATTGTLAITVVAPLGPLHPAAIAMTETAEAAPTVDPLEALSANGGRIVYYAERDNQDAELYLLDLGTGLEQSLSHNDDQDIYPVVSPDGTQVVFMSNRDGDHEIYVLNLDCIEAAEGSDACEAAARQLTDNNVEDRTPAWSPDGSTILYASDTNFDGQFDIYEISLDEGSEPYRLTETDTRSGHPSVSPDGRYIVFHTWAVDDPETGQIMRLDTQNGVLITLGDEEGNDWAPVYSPDGRSIAFLRRGAGRAAIWVMDANGRNWREVYDGPGYDWGVSWSPDGQLLTFTSDESGAQEVYLLPAEGTEDAAEIRRITTGGGEYPSWVP